MSEFGNRIPELPRATTGIRSGVYPKWNHIKGRVEQVALQHDLGATRADMDWNAGNTYVIDDYVLYQGLTAWKSLQNGNQGNIPAENSFWTQVSISEADGITLTTHSNGLFTYNNSAVQVNGAIYFLNIAAPYLSSDFSAELTAGDWISAPLAAQNYVDNIPQATPPSHSEGRFYYDDVKKNFVFYNDRTGVAADLPREFWLRSINKTGTGSTNGKIVYISGASSGLAEVSLADASSEATSKVIAVYTEDVAIDDNGEATTHGQVNNIDTSAWAPGTELFLSDTTPGEFTDVEPMVPSSGIPVAYVITQHATEGSIFVRVGDAKRPQVKILPSSWSAYSGSITATNWLEGFYTFNSSVTPSGGGTTIANANSAHGAHVYIVLGAASTDMVLRFTGTSIDDSGTRTPGDTEDIDTSGGALNDYFETKKFIGAVSMTLLSGTAVAVNYGLSAYWDNFNTRFIVTDFEWVGRAGANDSAPNIRVFHHKSTGWTYGAGGATPPTAFINMATTYVTERQFVNGRYFKFKFSGLNEVISGETNEGILIGIDISANNAVANSNIKTQIIGS